ncbi:DnaB-like helicase N-terminal domain-containing protein [Nostoc sp. UHCC 0302]|uniref:DnaB-like helicase N-terminal domain-containing protein n=1 Tax=Nostoc sp. UHCC 0302 TaxID=3134896 RepID=UPI00311CB7FD
MIAEAYVIEAEVQVLGMLLFDQAAIARVIDMLKAEYFSVHSHQKIYQAILAVHSSGRTTDVLNVCHQLKINGQLLEVGGHGVVGRMIDTVVTSANIDHLAALIIESRLGELIACRAF